MRSTLVLSAIALSLSVSAVAQAVALNQTEYASELLGLLQTSNLTVLQKLAIANAATLIPLLYNGNHTVFAPTDAAFGVLPNSTLDNPAVTAQVVLYHILNQSYPTTSLSPTTHTIATSLLTSKSLVNLGGDPQVVVLESTPDSLVKIIQPTGNITSGTPIVFQNLIIYPVSTVLSIPTLPSITLAAANLTTLVSVVNSGNLSEVQLLNNTLNTTPNITIFAPSNGAFLSLPLSALSNASNSSIATVVQNHIITGAVYSTALTNGASFTTSTGQSLGVIVNASGTFVAESGGGVSAKIVQSDLLTSSGAIHIIDNVLFNTNTGSSGPQGAGTSSGTSGGSNSSGSISGSGTPNGSAPARGCISAVIALLAAVFIGSAVALV